MQWLNLSTDRLQFTGSALGWIYSSVSLCFISLFINLQKCLEAPCLEMLKEQRKQLCPHLFFCRVFFEELRSFALHSVHQDASLELSLTKSEFFFYHKGGPIWFWRAANIQAVHSCLKGSGLLSRFIPLNWFLTPCSPLLIPGILAVAKIRPK